jgi:1-phosphofructokinase family hexose kinase
VSGIVCVAPNPSIDRLVEVERLVPGSIHRPTLVRANAGGKGLNVARAACALGASVTAVGIAAGHGGRWLAEALAADGVTGRFVWASGETRICTSIADRSTAGLTELYEPGPAIDDRTWAAFEAEVGIALADGRPDVMAISGSLPPGAPGDGHTRLLAIARAAGVPAGIDGFSPTPAGGSWDAVLATGPWLVKANATEGATFTRWPVTGSETATRAAQALVRSGASGAVVTLGIDGAVAAIDGAVWRIGRAGDPGRYPVGSGDAFLAGLLVARAGGLDTRAGLALAAGAAAANAETPGAGSLVTTDARRRAEVASIERIG